MRNETIGRLRIKPASEGHKWTEDETAIISATAERVALAAENGFPALAFSSSLAYFDAYRSARLPANLTQAQRDYFGAHTYRRVDRAGSFHTQWIDEKVNIVEDYKKYFDEKVKNIEIGRAHV